MSHDLRNTTSRRALLAAAPAAVLVAGTTVAALAVTAEADPILEVIDRHRAALEVYDEAHEHFEAMDELYPRPSMPMEFPSWSVEERTAWVEANLASKGTPRDIAYDRWSDQCGVVAKITEELAAAPPTTMAGVAAVLAYWSEIMEEDEHDRDFHSTQEFLDKMGTALLRGAS
jgi:hypothetical protein